MREALQSAAFNMLEEQETTALKWTTVDDKVMGGESQSTVFVNTDGTLVFAGIVNLINDKGFCSVKRPIDLSGLTIQQSLKLKLRGDGLRYQFRIKDDRQVELSYIQYFDTNGRWQELIFRLDQFTPHFRGRDMRMPNFESAEIKELGFLIANGKNEAFTLEIDSIELI